MCDNDEKYKPNKHNVLQFISFLALEADYFEKLVENYKFGMCLIIYYTILKTIIYNPENIWNKILY